MATLKHVTVIHPKFGDILNESFIEDIQFKLFLNISIRFLHTLLLLCKQSLHCVLNIF